MTDDGYGPVATTEVGPDVGEKGQFSRKAQLQALAEVSRLHIDRALEECKGLGLREFLQKYGYAYPQKYWIEIPEEEIRYPAKAIVGAAISKLPERFMVSAKEFWGGAGEAEACARLKELNYEVIGLSVGVSEANAFSRDAIEAAMNAYDDYRNTGVHSEIFGGFGEPKDYWVLSTRKRANPAYPSKSIVGFILKRTTLNGGWGSKSDAAARLFNAGYIIVDADQKPSLPPERYGHLVKDAERIRLCALNYYVEPAREQKLSEVSIRSGDLHGALGLNDRLPNVCQALRGGKFLALAGLSAPEIEGPDPSSTTVFTYKLHQQDVSQMADESENGPRQHATNLILYGPPGTGKTYATAKEAVRLCLGADWSDELLDPEKRTELMDQYKGLVEDGRIAFVTFHQSFSYEEFVEGLRPVTAEGGDLNGEASNGGFSLKPHEGAFKTISEKARLDTGADPSSIRMDRTRSIYKIALGRRGKDEAQIKHALDNSYIHLGWGGDVDWSDERFDEFEEIKKEWQEHKDANATGKDPNIEMAYAFRAGLQEGDYVVVSDGRDLFRAIGEVTGPYLFKPQGDGLPHQRTVRWIWKDESGNDIERSLFYAKGFRQQTVYRLNSRDIDWEALDGLVIGGSKTKSSRPFVLIIDEINRANISKVFGELITLLEPDKRLGEENEIKLRLPYSGVPFGVPANLHIIGTMNTADRSIALLDTALRRRFQFRELMPDPTVLSDNVDGINLQKLLNTLNERIELLFDREHQIGHAYFIRCTSLSGIEQVIRNSIIPLLSEYFYEDWAKVAAVLEGEMVGAGKGFDGCFLTATLMTPSALIKGAEDYGDQLRWQVKDRFDFSKLVAQ